MANVRVHATTRRVVAEHFTEEHPSLQGLPAGAFQAVLRMERRITRDGMVSVNGNLYSVPNATRRRPVECCGGGGSRTSAATRSRSISLTAWVEDIITTLSRLAFMGRAWDRSGWLNRLQAAADGILAATVRMRT